MPVEINTKRLIVDFILLVILAIPMLIFHKWIKPYKRGFYCDDESIRYPYMPSTVTRHELIAVGMTIPIVTIILTELYRVLFMEKKCATQFKKYQCGKRQIHRFFVRIYVFLGYFFLGVCFNQLMVDVGKYTIGRHRPHFIEVCKPNIGYKDCPGDHQYISNFNCTGEDKNAIHESMLSFYSGHSSFSFFVAWFLSLYLRARLYRPLFSRLIVPIIQFSLFFGATWVAYTRISDYKHHWSDVLIGSLLGSSIGIVLALYIAEVFKRREIPPAHIQGCQFGIIPIDGRNVINVEEGVGIDVPLTSTKQHIVTAQKIVIDDRKEQKTIYNTHPTSSTTQINNQQNKEEQQKDESNEMEYHLLQPTD